MDTEEDARDIRRQFLAALMRSEAFAAAVADELGLVRLAASIRTGLPALKEELERMDAGETGT
jgi:hypothetical protein